jgi:hypothetical protein
MNRIEIREEGCVLGHGQLSLSIIILSTWIVKIIESSRSTAGQRRTVINVYLGECEVTVTVTAVDWPIIFVALHAEGVCSELEEAE